MQRDQARLGPISPLGSTVLGSKTCVFAGDEDHSALRDRGALCDLPLGGVTPEKGALS